MPGLAVDGLDGRWARTAARRVVPDIGARVAVRAGIDPDSAAAQALASGLVDAFNAGAQEWNTEFQARLIEAGMDVNLRPGPRPARRTAPAAEAVTAAGPDRRFGRLAHFMARRAGTTPAIAAAGIAVMVLLGVAVAALGLLVLGGAAQAFALVLAAAWLGLILVAHVRAAPIPASVPGRRRS